MAVFGSTPSPIAGSRRRRRGRTELSCSGNRPLCSGSLRLGGRAGKGSAQTFVGDGPVASVPELPAAGYIPGAVVDLHPVAVGVRKIGRPACGMVYRGDGDSRAGRFRVGVPNDGPPIRAVSASRWSVSAYQVRAVRVSLARAGGGGCLSTLIYPCTVRPWESTSASSMFVSPLGSTSGAGSTPRALRTFPIKKS